MRARVSVSILAMLYGTGVTLQKGQGLAKCGPTEPRQDPSLPAFWCACVDAPEPRDGFWEGGHGTY